MVETAPGEYRAEVVAKVGPVKAAFTAAIALRDVVPPASYRLDIQIKGGAAGFAKGVAEVALHEVPAGASGETTLLRYRIEGGIGGKLAQIGARLVDGVARRTASRFFERFVEDFGSGPARIEQS